MKLNYKKYTLDFTFPAGTSRGTYLERDTWIIVIEHDGRTGYGECPPLKGLSIDNLNRIDSELDRIKPLLAEEAVPDNEKEVYQCAARLIDPLFPAIRFALETALLDLISDVRFKIFDSPFLNINQKIPINGLIWMGDKQFMKDQAMQKPLKGYQCIKMKIGAIDFEEEFEIIKYIREQNPEVVLRLDANGAFEYDEAVEKFSRLEEFSIHSIEQPLKAGQREDMRRLVKNSNIPVALDEELIGINSMEAKIALIKEVNPDFIILKPALVGGFASSLEWIEVANKEKIGWWITSALESNIGLNAIAQFTSAVNAVSFQGLGTGQLYENNFDSPLTVDKGAIFYDHNKKWVINL